MSVVEWKYHMNFLGIEDHDWGLDHNKGIVFSYANAALNIKYSQQAERYGTILFDIKDMSILEDVFVRAEDVDISNISLIYQKSAYTDTSNSIKGGVSKG